MQKKKKTNLSWFLLTAFIVGLFAPVFFVKTFLRVDKNKDAASRNIYAAQTIDRRQQAQDIEFLYADINKPKGR
ncbi:MAG: hypothetical protein HQL26_06165 [Candidatus Omnitrophica bacterium]|nr:hypothetical protein [Candidatus Omnitrophota bacterium]